MPTEAFAGFEWVSPEPTLEEMNSYQPETMGMGAQYNEAGSHNDIMIPMPSSVQASPLAPPGVSQHGQGNIGSANNGSIAWNNQHSQPSMINSNPVQHPYTMPYGNGALSQQPMPSPQMSPAKRGYAPEGIVQGFGNNLPMALALSQVLPSQYSFAFGQGVDPGQKISWVGGKPWIDVLYEMLSPLGLKINISGRIVYITGGGPDLNVVQNTQSGVLSPMPTYQQPSQNYQRQMQVNNSAMNPPSNQRGGAFYAAPQQQSHQPLMPMAPPQNNSYSPPSQSFSTSAPVVPPKYYPQASSPNMRTWQASRGSSLKETLAQWGHRANIKVMWQIERDYQIANNVSIGNTFIEAVHTLLNHGLGTMPAPPITYYETPNQISDGVLIVGNKGSG